MCQHIFSLYKIIPKQMEWKRSFYPLRDFILAFYYRISALHLWIYIV